MIGGYLYTSADPDIEVRLRKILHPSFQKIEVWDNGYLFFDNPFGDSQASFYVGENLILLSQDLLVKKDSDGEYRLLNLQKEMAEVFAKNGTEAFDCIACDFRMIAVSKAGIEKTLFLVSNRAGSGRIYFHVLGTGILFCSDLRLLLKMIQFDVSQIGIYAILKYGAIPEPLTVSEHVSAVPAGHYLEFTLNDLKYALRPYFQFRFSYRDSDVFDDSGLSILEPVKDALHRSARFLVRHNPIILLSGGIDSSLYGCYLAQYNKSGLKAFYCAFGENDPELPFAKHIAQRIHADLEVTKMERPDALTALEDIAQLTDHPFSDFSSLPIVFILKHIKGRLTEPGIIIECNGGDDCFGFPDLENQNKFRFKHRFPRLLKKALSFTLRNHPSWKWESHKGILGRFTALADVHENAVLNYFLVLAPMNYLGLRILQEWDEKLEGVMESVFSACGADYGNLDYKAKTTIRQLIHVNSRRWAAKALSVGESLGLRVIYPYLCHEILVEQGQLPWSAKVHNGIVKWPLKRLLQEFMPESFIYRKKSGFVPPFGRWLTDRDFNHNVRDILMGGKGHITQIVPPKIFDELLSDALGGKELKHSILNFLWGAVFTEIWLRKYKQ